MQEDQGIFVYTLSSRFSQALIIIDDTVGMISTGNLDTESFAGVPHEKIAACRDFSVPILDKPTLKNMKSMFLEDIHDKRHTPQPSKLIWGRDQQQTTFLKMMNCAKKSIHI